MSGDRETIEQLLAPGYTAEGWSSLHSLLFKRRKSTDLDALVTYAESFVNSWTDAQRNGRVNEGHYIDHYVLAPTIRLLRQLKVNRLSEVRGGTYLRLLRTSPHARNLASIEIASCELDLYTVSQFCEKADLPALRRLIVRNTFLARDEPDLIRASPLAMQLDELEIVRCRIG